MELYGIVACAIICRPRPANGKLMITQHINYTHAWYSNFGKVRPFGHGGSHKQSAIGTAVDSQFIMACVLVIYKVLGRRYKIVEHILLVQFGSCFMPFFSILSSTP